MNSFKDYLFEALHNAIWRVKSLSKEKIILLFFKSTEHYQLKSYK